MALEVLRREYPGDPAWRRFVAVFRPAWEQLQNKSRYSAALGDEEIAIVLTASMGSKSVDWFNQPCKALEDRIPSNVLKSELLGAQVIRTLLMRMSR